MRQHSSQQHSPQKTPTGVSRVSKKSKSSTSPGTLPNEIIPPPSLSREANQFSPSIFQHDGFLDSTEAINELTTDFAREFISEETEEEFRLLQDELTLLSPPNEMKDGSKQDQTPPTNPNTSSTKLVSYDSLPNNVIQCYSKGKKVQYSLSPHGVSPIANDDSATIGYMRPLTKSEHNAVFHPQHGLLPKFCPVYLTKRNNMKKTEAGEEKRMRNPRNGVERLIDGYCEDKKCNYKFIICRIWGAILFFESGQHGDHRTFPSSRGDFSLSVQQKEFLLKNKPSNFGPIKLLQHMHDEHNICFSDAQLDPKNSEALLKVIDNYIYRGTAKQLHKGNDWNQQQMTDEQTKEVCEILSSRHVDVLSRTNKWPQTVTDCMLLKDHLFEYLWKHTYVVSHLKIDGKWRVAVLSRHAMEIITLASQMFSSDYRQHLQIEICLK